jgi:hypothetical protein
VTRKQIIVVSGGLTTTFTQSANYQNVWQWVTSDTMTHSRIDGSEADSTSVLYMLFEHMQDNQSHFSSRELDP